MQRPRILHRPPSASRSSTDTGQDAVDLAAAAGLDLDPWQRFVLVESLSERPDGKWSAFECALLTPRQNGKNAILEARELVGLFLLDDERLIVHTAHEFATAMEHFLRIRELIEGCPALAKRVESITTSNGKEGIELSDGSRLRFKARTGGAGRGFSGDLVVLDEAYELKTAQMRALMPTLSARPNPQIWFASTAVDQMEQPNGVVLARVRERAVDGDGSRLFFAEWSVDEKLFWDDPETVAADPEMWAQANPALGIRIDPAYVAAELDGMDVRSFGVERLGVGDWPTVSEVEEHVIDLDLWEGLADPTSAPQDPVAFAVDVSPDRSWATIAAAGRRDDGLLHVEITGQDGRLDHRRGVRWVVPRLLELIRRHDPCVVLIDGRSAATSLIPDLEAEGITTVSDQPNPSAGELVVKSTADDMRQACGGFYDDAVDGQLFHLGQPDLNRAVESADRRKLGEAWAWTGKAGADVTPLVAVTLARHGLRLFGGDDTTKTEAFALWA